MIVGSSLFLWTGLTLQFKNSGLGSCLFYGSLLIVVRWELP